MRPLKLVMSAFGPYAGHVEIPMDELGESGLYLITGSTGAGKTTVFDAICYALYGEASGKNREAEMLRSKYADLDTSTEVELTFQHNGKVYRICRNPSYERRAKTGDKDKIVKATAQVKLYYPDGQIKTNVKEVNDAVKDLLGIDREQFAQIAMISQGEFLKLLLANSNEREKIYRDLFHTENFRSLQVELSKITLDAEDEAKRAKESIKQYVSGIVIEEDSAWSSNVQKARNGEMMTEDIVALLQKLIDEDLEKEKKLAQEAEAQDEVISEVQKKIGEAQNIENTKKEMKLAKEKLAIAREEIKTKELTYLERKEAFSQDENLGRQIAKIQSELEEYQKLDELVKKIQSSETEQKNLKKNAEQTQEEQERLKSEFVKLQEELQGLKDAGVKKEQCLSRLEKAEQSQKELEKLGEELRKLEEAKVSLEQAKKKYLSDDQEYNEFLEIYREMDQAYRDGQAGILAEKLVDGIPCPVCGSTTHPQKAGRLEQVPTKEALEREKDRSEAAHRKATESSNQVSARQSEKNMLEKSVVALSLELLKCEDLDEIPARLAKENFDLTEEAKRLKQQVEQEQKNVNRKELLEGREIPLTEKNFNETGENLRKFREELAKNGAFLEAVKAEHESLKEKLSFSGKEEADRALIKLIRERNRVKDAYELAAKDYTDQKEIVTNLVGQVTGFEQTLQGKAEINLAELEQQKAEFDQAKLQRQRKGQTIHSRRTSNETTQANIQGKVRELSEKEKKHQWLKTLSDTANGKMKEKDKITLETYVQTAYFERILQRANLRLMKMSSAQYELKRKDKATKFTTNTALDMLVIDHYNGTERDVKSLSGGEQFMASLSLALGLSDEVQSSAGGIQIDTMFVDEGFGTLDSERLDQVYNALVGITEGNCLVGLISHVNELKNKIDKQIVVTKQQSGGSTVELVV